MKRLIAFGVGLCGVYYTLVGVLLYSVPGYFFDRVGHIGAFNPHYERDAGSFILPIGLALFFAARDPYRYWAIAAVAGLASALHLGSHIMIGAPSQTASLIFLAAVTAVLFLPAIAVARNARR